MLVAASNGAGEACEGPAKGTIGVVLRLAMRPTGKPTATPRHLGGTPCDIILPPHFIFNCVFGLMLVALVFV